MKIFHTLFLLLSAITLVGCEFTITTGDEDDQDELHWVIEESHADLTINPKQKYRVTITGSHNRVTLAPDVTELVVTGSDNYIEFGDDYIGEVFVTGSSNNLDGNDLAVGNIEVTGSHNLISIESYKELLDTGDNNQVAAMVLNGQEQQLIQ